MGSSSSSSDDGDDDLPMAAAAATAAGSDMALEPRVRRSLQRLSSSARSSNGSSSIGDARAAEVEVGACGLGQLHLRSGAVLSGTFANRVQLDIVPDDDVIDELQPATFLDAARGMCVHGVWVFERLQYDSAARSPVAVYTLHNASVIVDDATHAYSGPAHLLLKPGALLLPLRRDLFPSAAAAGARQLAGQRRLTTEAAHGSLRREHRDLFFGLCGKEMAPSKWDAAILADLDRTHFHRFPDRSAADARAQLHSMLRYLAVAFPDVGYCQGMHCVGKFLLLFSEAPSARCRDASVALETERALVLMAQLLEDEAYKLRRLWAPGLAHLREVLGNVDARLALAEPVLAAHLRRDCGLSAVVYAARWALTLFTFCADRDFTSVLRAWLLFLARGWEAVEEVCVACLRVVKEHLMNGDAERCFLVLAGTSRATPRGLLAEVFGTHRGRALLRGSYGSPGEAGDDVEHALRKRPASERPQASTPDFDASRGVRARATSDVGAAPLPPPPPVVGQAMLWTAPPSRRHTAE